MIQFTAHITSRQNGVVTRYRNAARGLDRGVLLLDGPHLIAEAVTAGMTVHHAMISSEAAARPEIVALAERLRERQVELAAVNASVIAAASPVRTPSGIVAIADRPSVDESRLYPAGGLVIIACDIQDPGNLGAIVRVAEAAGASGVVAAGASVDPFGWKALRGSMGSAFRLPIAVSARVDLALAGARGHGCRLAATTARDGQSPFEADLRLPLAILVGGEGAGLSEAIRHEVDVRITVPMQPPVESLNVAVTAAVILYEVRRQRLRTPDCKS